MGTTTLNMQSLNIGDIVRKLNTGGPDYVCTAVYQGGVIALLNLDNSRTEIEFEENLIKPVPFAEGAIAFTPSRRQPISRINPAAMGNTTSDSASGAEVAVADSDASHVVTGLQCSPPSCVRPTLIVSRPGERLPAKGCIKLSLPPSQVQVAGGEDGSDGEGGEGELAGGTAGDDASIQKLQAGVRKAKKLAKKKDKRKAEKVAILKASKPHVQWGEVQLREYERSVYGSCGVPEGEHDEMLWILGLSDVIVVHTHPDRYEVVDRPEWPEDVHQDAAADDEDSDDEAVLKGVTAAEAHRTGGGRHHTPGMSGKKGHKKGVGRNVTPMNGPRSGLLNPASSSFSATASHSSSLDDDLECEPLDLGASAAGTEAVTPVTRRVATSVGIICLGSVDSVHAIRDPLVEEERARRLAGARKELMKSRDSAGKKKPKLPEGVNWHVAKRLDCKDRQAVLQRDLSRFDFKRDAIVRKNLIQAARAKSVHESRRSANCSCKKVVDPYDRMNKAELAGAAGVLGLLAEGTKAEILFRLRSALQAKRDEEEAAGRGLPPGLCHGHTHRKETTHPDAPPPHGFWSLVPTIVDDACAHARAWRLAKDVLAEDEEFWAAETPGLDPTHADTGLAFSCPCAVGGVGCCDECACTLDLCANPGAHDGSGFYFDKDGVNSYREALLVSAKKLAAQRASSLSPITAPQERPFTEPEPIGGGGSAHVVPPQPLFFTAEECTAARDKAVADKERAAKAAAAEAESVRETAHRAARATLQQSSGKRGKKGKEEGAAGASNEAQAAAHEIEDAYAKSELETSFSDGEWLSAAGAATALDMEDMEERAARLAEQEAADEEFARKLAEEDGLLDTEAASAAPMHALAREDKGMQEGEWEGEGEWGRGALEDGGGGGQGSQQNSRLPSPPPMLGVLKIVLPARAKAAAGGAVPPGAAPAPMHEPEPEHNSSPSKNTRAHARRRGVGGRGNT